MGAGKKGNYFGLFSPELKNKQITYSIMQMYLLHVKNPREVRRIADSVHGRGQGGHCLQD